MLVTFIISYRFVRLARQMGERGETSCTRASVKLTRTAITMELPSKSRSTVGEIILNFQGNRAIEVVLPWIRRYSRRLLRRCKDRNLIIYTYKVKSFCMICASLLGLLLLLLLLLCFQTSRAHSLCHIYVRLHHNPNSLLTSALPTLLQYVLF